MDAQTIRTFLVATAILDVLALAILSPGGRFFCALLAVMLMVAPVILARGRQQALAAAMLLLSVALVAGTYRDFAAEMSVYKERARD